MKLNAISLLTLLSLVAFLRVSAQVKPVTADEATNVLKRLSEKLNSIKHINYDYYRDVNYRSEQYRNEIAGHIFLEFESAKDTAAFKFQIESEAYKQVFDGATSFFIDKNEKTMKVNKQARTGDFSSVSFFVNSIVTLRRSMPALIADQDLVKTLSDTTINKKPYQLVSFTLSSKTLSNLGQITTLTSKRSISYNIIFDKSDYLPLEVIQTNSVTPEDYVLTRFTNYKVNADVPAESTWHYFNYVDQYKPIIKNQ